ncbi:vWA domain-containing protein [Gephyromycinifex aptenodytis]|uniref:vWA domain-containing protein n=1 Tax=Gephyromycinifex aptenodytis TaxID=2716227 RepID=UPI00144627F4|nr:VWA domain-containing protein [Gephyromycinifex aptenodytis]
MKAILWPLIGLLVLLALAWTTLFGLASGSDSSTARSPEPTFTTTPAPSADAGSGSGSKNDGSNSAPDSGRDERLNRDGEPSFLDRLRGRTDTGSQRDRNQPGSSVPEQNQADPPRRGGSFLDRLRGRGREEPAAAADPRATPDSSPGARAGSAGRGRDTAGGAPSGGADSKLMIVLDASGSMARENNRGGTSMSAAQNAVDQMLGRIDPATQVGLRVFGSEVNSGGKPTPQACRDTRLITPLAPLDRNELRRSVRSFQPVGETPIGYTVEKAIGDLGSGGERSILLVSDGEESCRPDPCEALRKAESSGVDVRIHTVGVRVDANARRQLSCLAEYSGGTYTEARSDAELAAAMRTAIDDFTQAAAGNGIPSRDGSAATRGAEPAPRPAQQLRSGQEPTGLSPGAAAAAILALIVTASAVKGSRKK